MRSVGRTTLTKTSKQHLPNLLEKNEMLKMNLFYSKLLSSGLLRNGRHYKTVLRRVEDLNPANLLNVCRGLANNDQLSANDLGKKTLDQAVTPHGPDFEGIIHYH
ncbi:hypothetical protein CEXT_114731 [Caerostris extrusa]|uniref:Uncharacterized protein n=1 Tax=Caerostris extrusa TaxID=172846 RepID=A0AAV4X5M4_CAEEX|nr:hypothetical protein CEXT_114731 [Caerostris extrusa]